MNLKETRDAYKHAFAGWHNYAFANLELSTISRKNIASFLFFSYSKKMRWRRVCSIPARFNISLIVLVIHYFNMLTAISISYCQDYIKDKVMSIFNIFGNMFLIGTVQVWILNKNQFRVKNTLYTIQIYILLGSSQSIFIFNPLMGQVAT